MAKKPNADIQAILDDLAQDARIGNVQYLKDGDTTIKLLLPAGRTIRTFYERFFTTFEKKGQKGVFEKFPYFLICGVITEADADGVADAARVRYIKVSKTVMGDLVNLLGKGWDLFGEDGPQVSIVKGKAANGQVAYKTSAIPLSFNAGGLEFPEQDIADAARDQEQSSEEFATKEVVGAEALA